MLGEAKAISPQPSDENKMAGREDAVGRFVLLLPVACCLLPSLTESLPIERVHSANRRSGGR